MLTQILQWCFKLFIVVLLDYDHCFMINMEGLGAVTKDNSKQFSLLSNFINIFIQHGAAFF